VLGLLRGMAQRGADQRAMNHAPSSGRFIGGSPTWSPCYRRGVVVGEGASRSFPPAKDGGDDVGSEADQRLPSNGNAAAAAPGKIRPRDPSMEALEHDSASGDLRRGDSPIARRRGSFGIAGDRGQTERTENE